MSFKSSDQFLVSLYPTCGEAVITHRRYGSNAGRGYALDDLAEAEGRASTRSAGALVGESVSSPFYLDKRTQLNQARSARRRKKTVGRAAVHLGVDRMITFTTSPDANIYSTSELWKKFFLTRQSLSRAETPLQDWVSVIERHDSEKTSDSKRGSLHLHTLVKGFAPMAELDRFWPHGSVNLKVGDGTRQSSERMASYLGSYVGKDAANEALRVQGGANARLWSRSRGAVPPNPRLGAVSVSDALELVEGTLGPVKVKHLDSDENGRPECWIVSVV